MDIVLSEDFFPQIGGAHLWLYEVYRRWPGRVIFLTRFYDRDPVEVQAQAEFDCHDHGSLRIVRSDIAIGEINLFRPSCWLRFWRVTAQILALGDSGPRTVHCLRAFPEGFAGVLAKLSGPLRTRLVTFAHGEEILVAKSSRQLRWIAGLVYRFSDAVIANSKSTESLVKELAPSARIVCVSPGVDFEAYRRDSDEIARYRRSWGWPEDTLVVATVARMEPRKNQAAVIRAISRLQRDGLRIGYVCGSDGEERENLVALAVELGLRDWVRFPGQLAENDKVLTFCAADIHAMPSVRVGEMIEGFGIVFLEAGAAGTPSIAGNVGGQPEAVLDGETGFVVDGGSVCQIVDAIRRLASSPALRHRMAQQSRDWAQRNDWTVVTARTRSVVETMASGCSVDPRHPSRADS